MTRPETRKGSSGSYHIVLESPKQFKSFFIMSFVLHAILIGTLLVFYPPEWVTAIGIPAFLFYVYSVITAKKAFDHLTTNLLLRFYLLTAGFLYVVLAYIGACLNTVPDNPVFSSILIGIGIFMWMATAVLGFSQGVRMHERNLKKRTGSINWEDGTYDVSTHSLDLVDINSAVLKSFPTWKIFFFMGAALSPGPIIAILVGKASQQAQYMIAVPVFWGINMFIGLALLRLFIDFWTVRKLETLHGVRLLVSTSPLAKTF